MGPRHLHAVLGLAVLVVVSAPAAAQGIDGRVVLFGRAEDAVTREPIQGARFIAIDSSTSVLSGADGRFRIVVPSDKPLALISEGFGYRSQRFELDASAPSRLSVLLLEPAPVEIEGITVVDEAAVVTLQRNLHARRTAYPYQVLALDRMELDRYVGASAYDVIKTRVPRAGPCFDDPGELCMPGRVLTVNNPDIERRVSVCVDGWRSLSSLNELTTLPIDAVALVEFYLGPTDASGAQVRVYTARWIVTQAAAGRTRVRPLLMGC